MQRTHLRPGHSTNKTVIYSLLRMILGLFFTTFSLIANATTSSTATFSANPPAAASPSITTSQLVTEVVVISFFVTSGNLPSSISTTNPCPTSLSASSPSNNGATGTTGAAVYSNFNGYTTTSDYNFNSVPIYPGFTCNILFTHYVTPGVSTAQLLANQYGVALQGSSASATSQCAAKFPSGVMPTGVQCIQGPLSAIDGAQPTNVSICYNDTNSGIPTTAQCAWASHKPALSCTGGVTWDAITYTPQSANTIYITSPSGNTLLLPACSSGTINFYLSPGNTQSYKIQYNRSVNTESANSPATTCVATGSYPSGIPSSCGTGYNLTSETTPNTTYTASVTGPTSGSVAYSINFTLNPSYSQAPSFIYNYNGQYNTWIQTTKPLAVGAQTHNP